MATTCLSATLLSPSCAHRSAHYVHAALRPAAQISLNRSLNGLEIGQMQRGDARGTNQTLMRHIRLSSDGCEPLRRRVYLCCPTTDYGFVASDTSAHSPGTRDQSNIGAETCALSGNTLRAGMAHFESVAVSGPRVLEPLQPAQVYLSSAVNIASVVRFCEAANMHNQLCVYKVDPDDQSEINYSLTPGAQSHSPARAHATLSAFNYELDII